MKRSRCTNWRRSVDQKSKQRTCCAHHEPKQRTYHRKHPKFHNRCTQEEQRSSEHECGAASQSSSASDADSKGSAVHTSPTHPPTHPHEGSSVRYGTCGSDTLNPVVEPHGEDGDDASVNVRDSQHPGIPSGTWQYVSLDNNPTKTIRETVSREGTVHGVLPTTSCASDSNPVCERGSDTNGNLTGSEQDCERSIDDSDFSSCDGEVVLHRLAEDQHPGQEAGEGHFCDDSDEDRAGSLEASASETSGNNCDDNSEHDSQDNLEEELENEAAHTGDNMDGVGSGDVDDDGDVAEDGGGGPIIHHNLPHGDDPDDPGDDDPQGDASSEETGEESDEGDNFSFDHRRLNVVCMTVRDCTARESLAMLLAISVRDRLTYEALIHLLKVFNAAFGRDYLPVHKKQLWHWLGRNDVGLKKYVYCHRCHAANGKLEDLQGERVCVCGMRLKRSNAKYFIALSLKKQLFHLLQLPSVRAALAYRDERQARIPGGMEDILDGGRYQNLRNDEDILGSPHHFSYNFNTDGFRLTKSSTLEAWPIFLTWNELPWKLRRKHKLVAAIWADLPKPNMNLFIDHFVAQANTLSNEGIVWQRDGVEVRSKFFPACCVVDAQARCALLNMQSPTGYCACPFCDHAGLRVGGAVHFPILPPVPIPRRRTDEGIKASMVEAYEQAPQGVPHVAGFHGPSDLMNLDYFDLGRGIVTDDIHPICGVIEFHMSLLMTRTREYRPPYYIGDSVARIDSRLISIRTPTHISRKPRSFTTRNQWKSSEWRNWLLYYMVPCLEGILNERYLSHLELLSQAVFLVCRDSVTPQSCNEAERLFTQYVETFERLFGRERMRYNVHVLLHVPDCVRDWGPMFAQSTTIYETWNHDLMQTVTSPKAPCDQIVTRFLIHRFLDHVQEDERVSERVKVQINKVLNGTRLHNAVRVGTNLLLGKATLRDPTARETALLQQNNFGINRLICYDRAATEAGEFRTSSYRYGGEEVKSDNSFVLTWNDEFCRIQTIAVVTREAERIVVLFSNVLNTPNHRNRYVSRVAPGEDVLILLAVEDIRSHAIMCNTPAGQFVMPLCNRQEID